MCLFSHNLGIKAKRLKFNAFHFLRAPSLIFVFQRGVKQIPSYKFLPLMYQLAARMGTKMANGITEDTGFHVVLSDVMQNCFNLH